MIRSPEVLKVLESAPLFKGVPASDLIHKLDGTQVQELQPGQVLLYPGQNNSTVYIVLSGRLDIQSRKFDTAPFAVLGEGETAGEMSMLSDAPVSAFVIAATPCKLLAIDQATMWDMIDHSFAAAHNMLNILTSRIRNTNQVVAESLERQQGYAVDSKIDELTGLYNQSWAREKFDRYLKRCITGHQPGCMLMMGMDNYSEFMEKHGQLGSDQALRDIAYTILSCMRPDDQASHISGAKFAIFLPYTMLEEAGIVAARLQKAIHQSYVVLPSGDALPSITVSIGISQVRPDDNLDMLFDRANKTLLMAYARGGNSIKSVP